MICILSILPPTCRSFLPLVAAGVEWCPEYHSHFPPAFRATACTLLLANECHGLGGSRGPSAAGEASAESAQRTRLPPEVLHHILRLAARPLHAWVPELSAPLWNDAHRIRARRRRSSLVVGALVVAQFILTSL